MIAPRRLATATLLAFVVVSAGYLALQASSSGPAPAGLAGEAVPAATDAAPPRPPTVAYYFHGRARCVTCTRLETYAQEAIESAFADELTAGQLAWKSVDISAPENRHFATDYQITHQSVILVEVADGKHGRWRNLDQIWQKVRDRSQYVAYVQQEVRRFLDGQ